MITHEDVQPECTHTWVAGMCIVDPQDLQATVDVRDVECEHCELVITRRADVPARFIWGED